MRKLFFSIGALLLVTMAMAQLKSPAAFLGYALGSRYTPHYKVVNYFNHVAATMASQVKVEQYGETNEGRPLLLAYVSSAENSSKLESIRQNNLRLAGLLTDAPAQLNTPGIVWLSYNVHGNEPSSSEAAMKTMYELLTAPRAKAWLENTVVIIDPCINPDGRDRYVNWFNQVVGKNYNANPIAREHIEPWPGGRTNHYNFDLNRDWAWQSQVETQQRIKKYLAWMPQIHCDYHEQGYNNPYYFAPAAEPLHEVITPWQRDFQTTIGRNHARYFDANGWLYFTRYQFDLFYPAYGDTYPTYNGAIGMTYEQAGHSRGGLAIVKNDGDTLTLTDRVEHHFTTGMSTVEIASQNATTMIREFKQYFDEAVKNGIGEYKSYIITTPVNAKMRAMTDLLDKNGIYYTRFGNITAKGYNYFSQKEESINSDAHNIIIYGKQPRSAMVKVLFEPKSKLSDSATYDITAWSLPYAYGMQAYALKDAPPVVDRNAPAKAQISKISDKVYGFLVPYNSFASAQLLANLLKNGVKVRFAETDFVYNKQHYAKGTLIILSMGNEQRMESIKNLLNGHVNGFSVVHTGFMDNPMDFGSEKVHFLHAPRVALITGENVGSNAAGGVWHFFEQQLDYPITLINGNEVGSVDWKQFDVMILPDGYYGFLGEKASSEIRSWVRQGGRIVAMEGAVSQMASNDWGIKAKRGDDDKKEEGSGYGDLKKYENRERDGLVHSIPGAIYKVEMDASHPLAFGYGDTYYTLKQDGNVYEFLKDGWNVGVLKKDNRVAGFAGSKVKEKLKDGTVMGVLEMGRGSVVFLAESPIFRSFWENGKLLLSNAVFLVGQ